MAYLTTLTTQDPSGNTNPLRANGDLASTSTPLIANATWSTGWLDVSGFQEIYFSLIADQTGSLTVSFSGNSSTVLSTNTRTYSEVNTFFRNAYPINTQYVKYDYVNGSVAQTKFWARVYLTNTSIGTSNFNLNQRLAATNIVDSTRAVIEVPDSTGTAFDMVQRTGNSLNVNVTNPTSAPSNQNVTVSNFPATQAVSLATIPLNTWMAKSYSYTSGVQTLTSTASTLGGLAHNNSSSNDLYLQIFNTTGTVTPGTTVPTWFFPLDSVAPVPFMFGDGITFSAGMKFIITTSPTGSTAPGSTIPITFFYK